MKKKNKVYKAEKGRVLREKLVDYIKDNENNFSRLELKRIRKGIEDLNPDMFYSLNEDEQGYMTFTPSKEGEWEESSDFGAGIYKKDPKLSANRSGFAQSLLGRRRRSAYGGRENPKRIREVISLAKDLDFLRNIEEERKGDEVIEVKEEKIEKTTTNDSTTTTSTNQEEKNNKKQEKSYTSSADYQKYLIDLAEKKGKNLVPNSLGAKSGPMYKGVYVDGKVGPKTLDVSKELGAFHLWKGASFSSSNNSSGNGGRNSDAKDRTTTEEDKNEDIKVEDNNIDTPYFTSTKLTDILEDPTNINEVTSMIQNLNEDDSIEVKDVLLNQYKKLTGKDYKPETSKSDSKNKTGGLGTSYRTSGSKTGVFTSSVDVNSIDLKKGKPLNYNSAFFNIGNYSKEEKLTDITETDKKINSLYTYLTTNDKKGSGGVKSRAIAKNNLQEHLNKYKELTGEEHPIAKEDISMFSKGGKIVEKELSDKIVRLVSLYRRGEHTSQDKDTLNDLFTKYKKTVGNNHYLYNDYNNKSKTKKMENGGKIDLSYLSNLEEKINQLKEQEGRPVNFT